MLLDLRNFYKRSMCRGETRRVIFYLACLHRVMLFMTRIHNRSVMSHFGTNLLIELSSTFCCHSFARLAAR
jgi:hypothetical protein